MSRSPAAAVRIRLFPAAAGVVAACGIAGLLPAQLPGGFHLYKWSGELGLEAERRDDRSTAANDEQLRQRETLFREALGIRTNGYAYHPALFDFEAGVRAEFDQREVETDPGDTQQYADSFRLFYDALAQILKEKPIHGDVYARRARLDTRQRFFATTTAEIATEGADLFWRDLWIPSALHYEHSRYVGEGRDTLRQSTERWRLEGTRSDERNHLGYNLEWNELDQQTFGTHYDELLASLHLGHRFGAQGAHSVTAGGTHRDRTGTQSSLYQQANGALHLQWLPELQSDHSISVDRSEIDSDLGIDVGRDGLIATSWLRHSLYESLETSLGGRYYRSDYEAGKLERRDAEFALDYHKSTSFGSIGLGYRPTVYREDEAGAGTAVPVVGESYTYTPGVPILLQSANVIATSVVVRDAALGTTFVQPADYLLVPVGPRLRIDVPVGSRIVGGTVLQIDYAYEPNPGRSYQGTSHSVALSFGGFRGPHARALDRPRAAVVRLRRRQPRQQPAGRSARLGRAMGAVADRRVRGLRLVHLVDGTAARDRDVAGGFRRRQDPQQHGDLVPHALQGTRLRRTWPQPRERLAVARFAAVHDLRARRVPPDRLPHRLRRGLPVRGRLRLPAAQEHPDPGGALLGRGVRDRQRPGTAVRPADLQEVLLMARTRPVQLGRAPLLACLALAAAACSGPTVFLRRPEQPLTWPRPPEPPRIEFVLAYRGAEDVERHPGFWASLGEWLSGAEAPEILTPHGLAVAPPDRLWVTDPGRAAVHRIDLVTGDHAAFAGTAAEPMVTPVGVAPGPDGTVFVSDSTRARILVLDDEGQFVRAFGSEAETGRPTGLAWDERGQRLLVLDTTGGRLLAYSQDGRLLQQAGGRGSAPGQFNYPTSLALAADGRVFVMDSLNFRVQVLGRDLQPRSRFGMVGRGPGCFAAPKGIALDSEGHVYVVDGMFENVQIFDDAGQLLLAFGGRGSALGALTLPTGIWIDAQDRIHVADSGNSRIQIFRYLRR
ncbi:MAG: hypothetical protein FJ265_12505 [Planctomycetes bacterium]|nr:hypothetical protein [Planctomycetota bacterium]